MKNNQGKTPQQYKDSVTFAFIGYVGIIIVVVATLLGIGSCTEFNREVQEGIKNDPRPANHLMNYTHPGHIEVIDSLQLLEDKDPDMMYHRWEGKEGKSEFGEYIPNDIEWGDQDSCGRVYKIDTIHVITEEGVNWYTLDSTYTPILKNHWKDIKNTKIKMKK